MATDTVELIEPSGEDVRFARESERRLREVIEANPGHTPIRVPSLGNLDFPAGVLRALAAVLHEFAGGHAVAVQTVADDMLSTYEAATLLGISRPTLIDRLESGEIPFERVGTHRRVRRSDVLAFRARMRTGSGRAPRPTRADRLQGLREMADASHDLGLGY